jgi:hypothetical protein
MTQDMSQAIVVVAHPTKALELNRKIGCKGRNMGLESSAFEVVGE